MASPHRFYGSLAEEGGVADDVASTPYQRSDAVGSGGGGGVGSPYSRLRSVAVAIGGTAAVALGLSWRSGSLGVRYQAREPSDLMGVQTKYTSAVTYDSGSQWQDNGQITSRLAGFDERHSWPSSYDGSAIEPDGTEDYGDYYVFFTAARYKDSPTHGGTYIYGAENGRMDLYANLTRDAYALKVDPQNATLIWTTTNGSIWRSDDMGGEDSIKLLYNYGGDPRGLDINPKHGGGDIYWADYDAGKIIRGSYYGERNQTIHHDDSGIFDVKLYITGRVCKHVYFTIPTKGIIARTNCQGQDYYELVQFTDISPHGIDIQIDLDYLFFTDGAGVIGHIENLDSCSTDDCNVTIVVNKTADDHKFLFCSGSAPHRKLYISDYKSDTVYSMSYEGGNLTAVVNVTRPIGVSTTLIEAPSAAPTQPQPSHTPTHSAPSASPTTNYSTMYWTHKEERVEERHELEAALAATSSPVASGTVAPTPASHPTPYPTTGVPTPQPTMTSQPTMTPNPSMSPTPVPSPAPTKSAVPSPEPTAWCKKDYYLYYTSGILGNDSFVEFLQDPTTVADKNQTHMAETDNDIYGLEYYDYMLFMADGNGTINLIDILEFNMSTFFQFPGMSPRGMAVNPIDSKLYWADTKYDGGTVWYRKINDADDYGYITQDIEHPFDVAVDWMGDTCNHIYVSSPTARTIYRISCADPSKGAKVFLDDLVEPYGMTIDTETGNMFFLDGYSAYIVPIANDTDFDAHHDKRIIATFESYPMFIRYDAHCERIFISEPDANKVWGIDMIGKFKTKLIEGTGFIRPRGLALAANITETWAPTTGPTPEPSLAPTPKPTVESYKTNKTTAWHMTDDDDVASSHTSHQKGKHGGNSQADKQHYHESDDDEAYHFTTSADDDIFITDDFIKNHGKNGGRGAHLGADQGDVLDGDDEARGGSSSTSSGEDEEEDDFFADDLGVVRVASDDDELADLTDDESGTRSGTNSGSGSGNYHKSSRGSAASSSSSSASSSKDIVTVGDDDSLAPVAGHPHSSVRKLASWEDAKAEKQVRYDHSDYTALFDIKRHDLSTGVGLAEVFFQVGAGEDVGQWDVPYGGRA